MFPSHHSTENKEMGPEVCRKPAVAQSAGGMEASARALSLEDASGFSCEAMAAHKLPGRARGKGAAICFTSNAGVKVT